MNEFINDGCDCRTAQATPSLLIIEDDTTRYYILVLFYSFIFRVAFVFLVFMSLTLLQFHPLLDTQMKYSIYFLILKRYINFNKLGRLPSL